MFRLPVTDRAFQYNDGFFETALVVNGQLRFWDTHQKRIKAAAEALYFELPAYFFEAGFELQLLELAKLQDAEAYGRLKLKVWRSGQGLYTPETNDINWLATIVPAAAAPKSALDIAICQTVYTSRHVLSEFKGPNAPLYALAGLEKKAKQKDDMLLLNPQGYVSELISSNIFWQKGNILYTPSIDTGCINGILRRKVLAWCHANAIRCSEVTAPPSHMLNADVVFATNVTGIRPIKRMDDIFMNDRQELIVKLDKDLKL